MYSRSVHQGLKPRPNLGWCGMAEAMPFQNTMPHHSSWTASSSWEVQHLARHSRGWRGGHPVALRLRPRTVIHVYLRPSPGSRELPDQLSRLAHRRRDSRRDAPPRGRGTGRETRRERWVRRRPVHRSPRQGLDVRDLHQSGITGALHHCRGRQLSSRLLESGSSAARSAPSGRAASAGAGPCDCAPARPARRSAFIHRAGRVKS